MKLETWLSLTAAIVSAIGTGLAAYAALEAARISQRASALQALDNFRSEEETHDRGKACMRMLLSATPQALQSLIHHQQFGVTINNPDAAKYCLRLSKEIPVGGTIAVDREQSRVIGDLSFNVLNSYEGILLYWKEGVASRAVICGQIKGEFTSLVVPFFKQLRENNSGIVDYFPALQEFVSNNRCVP
jgi:hypothetical protein